MHWVKFPVDLLRGPLLSTCTLVARGVFAILFACADAEGVVAVPTGVPVSEFIAAFAHDPHDLAAPNKGMDELLRKKLVIERDGGLFVPLRVGVGLQGRSAVGAGAQGGKTDAERAKEYRRRKSGRDPASPVTETVTAPSRDASRATVTGTVTDENVTVRDASRDSVTARMVNDVADSSSESPTVTGNVTTVTGSREEKNREEKSTEETTRARMREAAATTEPLVLKDGTSVIDALGILERASQGKFTSRASGKHQLDFAKLLVEHGAVRADLVALGGVLASPPTWSRITGVWTLPVLLGKADSAGKREGAMLTQLLAESFDRKEEAKRAASESGSSEPVPGTKYKGPIGVPVRPAFMRGLLPPLASDTQPTGVTHGQ